MTSLALELILVCVTPMILPSAVFAASPGDQEIAEATQAQNAGNYQQAEMKYRAAIQKFKDNRRDFPLSFALDSLGNLYYQHNQLGKAVDAYKSALEIRKAALKRGTDDRGARLSTSVRKSVQKDLGLAMMALGSVYTQQTDFESAERMLSDALVTIKSNWGPQDDCVGAVLAAIGDLRFAQGNHGEAEKYYRQALAIRRKYHALNDPALSALIKNIAAVKSHLQLYKQLHSSKAGSRRPSRK